MRIRLIAAGTRLPAWIDAGVEEYARRFGRGLKFELVEIPLAREAERMRAAIGATRLRRRARGRRPRDDDGRARRVACGTRMAGGKNLALLVGGPDGLDAGLSRRGGLPLVAFAADLAARPGAGDGRRAALSRAQPAARASLPPRLRSPFGYPRGSMGYDAIVLASASERRSQLLRQIGVRHPRRRGRHRRDTATRREPADYVQRLAAGKAQAVVARLGRPAR